jgi:hypothetical protein
VDLVGAEAGADSDHSTHTGERHEAAAAVVGCTSPSHNHNAQVVAA